MAQDALCSNLRKAGKLKQLQNVILSMGNKAAVSSSSTTSSSQSISSISLVSFNIYLASLCDVATEKDTSPKFTKSSRAEILHDAADWVLSSQSSESPQSSSAVKEEEEEESKAMRLLGVQPDAISYSTVLQAAATVGDYELADALWDDMKQQRKKNIVAYDARLKLLLRHRGITTTSTSTTTTTSNNNKDVDDEDIYRIWDELNSDPNVEPDRYTIDLMLLPLIRNNRWRDVEALLDKLITSNSDTVVSDAFAVFLLTITKKDGGNLTAARRLFDTHLLPTLSPVASGEAGAVRLVRLQPRHFNLLLEGYRDEITNVNKRRRKLRTPTTTATSHWSGSDERDGRNDEDDDDPTSLLFAEAWKLYDTMLMSKEIQPSEYTISIMTGLCRSSEELSRLLKQARTELGMINLDSALLRSVITAYGSLGDPSSACWVLARYADSPGDVRAWNVLLGALTDKASHLDNNGNATLDLSSSAAAQSLIEKESTYNVADEAAFSLLHGFTIPEAAQRVLDYIAAGGDPPRTRQLRPNSQTYCLVASALQYSATTTSGGMALSLFRNATKSGVNADGRFLNAVLRCFGDDIDGALSAWKNEIRPQCVRYEKRQRSSPPPLQRTEGKNYVAAYHGLLYVAGRALRPEIALRLAYAMKKEGLEPNETALRCYHSGRLARERAEGDEKLGFARRVRLTAPYESLLYIECTKYDRNDKRRAGERRVRIIV